MRECERVCATLPQEIYRVRKPVIYASIPRIEDVCGKRMLLQLQPSIGSKRACASSQIDTKSFKALCRVDGNKEGVEMFWELFEEFSNADRQLLIKFATGRTRLAQGERITIYISGNNDKMFPHGSTCGNNMSF